MKLIQKHKKMIIACLIILIIAVFAGSILIFQFVASNVAYSKEQAQDIVLEQFPGKVIEADVEHELLNTYYEFTILDQQSQEIEVVVDAKNGSIVEVDYD
ncbi:putative membrane protein YkoI [Breznakia sp. PF5-3]|uniref:PepSY domain-containing protein n=1 Tax=unclassified Breznakia TaxID=2623764 RepID=UPI002406E802|nr:MULTISPECIES: PepSY domain-containing protein [unclassified Breznakia]MDF9824005.1 putative membrane protein YkoI [Breznakia sp. PM6-1]MDF9834804.1 putative membrane protein YkoI [Breznakia sp. PF5-3]MDF9838123.1 putative membrane protein YkoI [Breznakia sp. PFB2-8]MDF9860109.1 putative membrane protein YkoI [Breznakia sp. PH5-24]